MDLSVCLKRAGSISFSSHEGDQTIDYSDAELLARLVILMSESESESVTAVLIWAKT